MKVENMFRKNRRVVVAGTVVAFDAGGCAEVDDKVGEALLKLGGYREPGKRAANTSPAERPAAATTAAPALDAMNTAQLKKLAKDEGIAIGDASKKAELIEVIEKARAAVQG